MAKDKKRFVETAEESAFVSGNQIIVDRETGVNYLFHYNGYAGGLTVLLDADGKPIVTNVEED